MGLRLDDKWIWDPWLAVDGADYHVYFLQAPRRIGDPELRHRNVSIGHAVSQDLRHWELLPDALHPAADAGAWDDFTTWTGSVIRHESLWYMFYTGGKRSEDALIQRIGFAVSHDLIHWQRYPGNPVILCDSERYESLTPEDWYELTWRDPWVMWDASNQGFCAFITARSRHGPRDGRGVIALAKSSNLREWQVLDPVTQPGEFGCMEVPQVVQIGTRFHLLFSTVKVFHSSARQRRLQASPESGIYVCSAEALQGPYLDMPDSALLPASTYTFYAGKILQDPYGHWVLLPMRYLDRSGQFVGEMHDPIPLHILTDGSLSLEQGVC
jgi:beta-fructofuranosidase